MVQISQDYYFNVLIISKLNFEKGIHLTAKIFLDCFDMNEMFFFFATLKKQTDTIL